MSGCLWETENADDAFSELEPYYSRFERGLDSVRWTPCRFPNSKDQNQLFNSAMQQVGYPPTRIGYSPALALSRLFMLPGATYHGSGV